MNLALFSKIPHSDKPNSRDINYNSTMATSLWLSLIIVYIILVGCQTGAFGYFATFVIKDLRPYFIENEMESDLITANEVFAYLVTSAVLAGLSVIGLYFPCLFYFNYTTNGPRLSKKCCLFGCASFFAFLVRNALGLFAIILACLIAYCSWGWWVYFDAEGYDHLATNCLALFGLAIASIALRCCHYVVTTAISKSQVRAGRIMAEV
ncbi:hypothetical protein F4820DRAFT_424533 [Hypoxylon rubiginosum]|uniref:Uncharacterized protein n=1 Tax=Hypoxylon rubiginosum TaxID=110542 RepID=A0ACB9YYP0_9PEZI|nr:hypothetical protein F4820DRAFT_424533 [Hypoxylon rubiginosum]